MTSMLTRRILGTVSVILLIAGAFLLTYVVGSPPAGSFTVRVDLGAQAGKGLRAGSDVKVRGVLVGTVRSIELDEDARPYARVLIRPVHRLPADVSVVVSNKTFLGEKQLELVPQSESLGAGEPLGPGAVLAVGREGPTEVQEFIAALEPVLDAIDPVELAAVVDTFGSFDASDARTAAENIEVSARLAEFGAETASVQLDRLSAAATLIGELATTADSFNRLNRSLPTWVSLLPDRQGDIHEQFELLSAFAVTLADLLRVEQDTIAEVLAVTTIVNGVLADQASDLSGVIFGVARYAHKLAGHGGSLNDGSEYGWFSAFMGGEGELEELCEHLPPEFQEAAPGCINESDSTDDEGGGSQ
ncbi:MAG: MCE family protein [Actinobacteria bacterium]|nr:MCE family protein [Actinomycetota bacterium]